MRIADAIARVGITAGGIGVIVAVLGILLYLTATALPLFAPGGATPAGSAQPAWGGRVDAGVLDEYLGSGLFLLDTGELVTASLDSGEVLARSKAAAPAGRTRTARAALNEGGAIALGYDDGSIQVGTLGFETDFLTADNQTGPLEALSIGGRQAVEGGYVERTIEGQIRRTRPIADLTEPVKLEQGDGSVILLDYHAGTSGNIAVAMRADGTTTLTQVRRTVPLGGGKPRLRLSSTPVRFQPRAQAPGVPGAPSWLFVSGDAAHVIALWPDGVAQRYAQAPDDEAYSIMETTRLLEEGRRVTSAAMLLGGLTLVMGDDQGGVSGAFPARVNSTDVADGRRLVVAHRYDQGSAPVTALGISARDRTFISGDERGGLLVRNMTSGKRVASVQDAPGAAAVVMIAPKLDAFARVDSAGGLALWRMDKGHPEASLGSLFGRVWYEGEESPQFIYQSTAGTDNAEPKISLVPLIFGTLKGTIFAMLFAVPVAVLAALYTSEMLHPRVRLGVKPVIEMMASLPSVVLGFVAAMVIAPAARDLLPAILVGFVAIPLTALAVAYLWQMLPVQTRTGLRTWQHLALVIGVLALGVGVSLAIGRPIERALFTPSQADAMFLAGQVEDVPRPQWPAWARAKAALESQDSRRLRSQGMYVLEGRVVRPAPVQAAAAHTPPPKADIRLWLNGVIGSALPGWLMLMFPPGLIVAVFLRAWALDPRLRATRLPRAGVAAAVVEFAKFLCTIAGGLLLAFIAAQALTALGADPRDGLMGAYNQRNTLIVAIVMGFAIIPIIYTLSEDAMSSVPGGLRSAALGCGATRWQTAVSVVLPLAMSGIFSACMIGLGRAAGETMIVLMATGNTPSMDWNIFSGFRTLAANIAVEMPEAPKGETHYRVLFLAGLCLFMLTFVVNTAAEMLRRRARRRGANL